MERLFNKPEGTGPADVPSGAEPSGIPPEQPSPVEPAPSSGASEPEKTAPPAPAQDQDRNEPPPSRPVPEAPKPAPAVSPEPGGAPGGSSSGPAAKPETASRRERSLYFMRLDKDGTIVRTGVRRALPASDSPMLDALQALLRGPSAEEQQRDLISLIPQGTRVLSATVRGDTAYISFSEEFQFNTYGVEGYAAQLRQIVWTVTEFSTVKDVQILIEGRRVDYLGEGIWIGSPINRDSL